MTHITDATDDELLDQLPRAGGVGYLKSLRAAFDFSPDPRIEAIRALLTEFTTYPERNFSITDHMFLDFEFWGRLTEIVDPQSGSQLEAVAVAPVIVLCGSTRFKDAINAENSRLTQEGNVVISLGVFGHHDLPDYNWDTDANDLKITLDRLHMQKIRMGDRVHVVNPQGYYGESTAREIAYARELGKPVTFMSAVQL